MCFWKTDVKLLTANTDAFKMSFLGEFMWVKFKITQVFCFLFFVKEVILNPLTSL